MLLSLDLHKVLNKELNLERGKEIRDDFMKKALDTKIELEEKLRELSELGKKQAKQTLKYVKKQPLANSLFERVEPLANDIRSKEQIIRKLVGNILSRAKDARATLLNTSISEQVDLLRNKVLKTPKKKKASVIRKKKVKKSKR
jgi:hypothetical protein